VYHNLQGNTGRNIDSWRYFIFLKSLQRYINHLSTGTITLKMKTAQQPPGGARQITLFFVPLAFQAIAQAFSHPLVAMVASRGHGGPLNLAGLAQSSTVMFFLGIFAIYYMTTGMVFARTREGYQTFARVCIWTGICITFIQGLLCIPVVSHTLFGRIIGLPLSIEQPAQITLLVAIPLQFFFFLRIPYQVVLYNGLATGRASFATVGRIVLTVILSWLFCFTGLVGPIWAVVCLTIPVLLEVVISMVFARYYLRRLPAAGKSPPRALEIFFFNLPLAVGGFFLVFSVLVLNAFIARAPEPERILPIFFLAIGLANPVAYAATRIQAVVLAFPPTQSMTTSTFRFALMSGAVLGLLPLMFIIPGLMELYYVTLQKLNPTELSMVRITAISLIPFPFAVALRAHSEGLAAWEKKTTAVLAGHGFYMAIVILSGFLGLLFGVPGYLIGGISLTLGSLVSAYIIRLFLRWTDVKQVPVGPTTTSVGQVR
jgi:hypothetical protein